MRTDGEIVASMGELGQRALGQIGRPVGGATVGKYYEYVSHQLERFSMAEIREMCRGYGVGVADLAIHIVAREMRRSLLAVRETVEEMEADR